MFEDISIITLNTAENFGMFRKTLFQIEGTIKGYLEAFFNAVIHHIKIPFEFLTFYTFCPSSPHTDQI